MLFLEQNRRKKTFKNSPDVVGHRNEYELDFWNFHLSFLPVWLCNNNNNNKIPFQIKFKYVICCGDGSALPGIEHRVTRRGESETNIQRKGQKISVLKRRRKFSHGVK